MFRRVACVSALICACTRYRYDQGDTTNPGRPSMTRLNPSYDDSRIGWRFP